MNPQFTNAKYIGHGIDPEDYHTHDVPRGDRRFVMSRSQLVNFASSPSRWLAGYKEDDGDTEATAWGSLIDCLVTEEHRFDDKFAVKPATYRNERGEDKPWRGNAKVCEAWEAEHDGKILVKSEKFTQAKFAMMRLLNDSELGEFITCSAKQVMCVADYKASNGVLVPVKILIDLVPDANHHKFGQDLGDLKTDRDASPGKYNRTVEARRYHWQAAMNLDVFNAARPDESRSVFRHVVSENVHPFEPGRRWIDSEMIQQGRAQYTAALELYAACIASNSFPSWDDQGKQLIPGWTQVALEAYMVK